MPGNRLIIEIASRRVNALRANFFTCTRKHRRLIGLSSLALLLLVACGESDEPDALFKRAGERVEAEELDDAIVLYQRIVDEHPTSSYAEAAEEQIAILRGVSKAEAMFAHRQARDRMVEVARAMQWYRSRQGRWPDRLDALVPNDLEALPVDPWGQPLIYFKKKSGGYVLATFGADHAPGGRGDAGDLFIEDGRLVERASVELPR